MKSMERKVQREMLARVMMPLSQISVTAMHGELFSTDPEFYAQLAVWYARHGRTSAHREAFVAELLNSDSHRAIGMALFRRLGDAESMRVVSAVRQRAPELARELHRVAAPRRGLRMWLRARRRVGRAAAAMASTAEGDKPFEAWLQEVRSGFAGAVAFA